MIINLTQKSITMALEFRGSCLKQDKSTFNNGKIVNIYIVYEIDKIYTKSHPTLVNCLFGTVSITKNADIVGMELDLIELVFIYYPMVVLVGT